MIDVNGKRMAIVVYSTNRSDMLLTGEWLNRPDCYLCIPESQVQAYQRTGTRLKIVPHPEEINRLPYKIEWVWDYFRDKCECVVKVDDDFEYVRDSGVYYFRDRDFNAMANLDGDEFVEIFSNLFQMSEDIGAKVFGFGNVNRFIHYNQMDRFSFLKGFDASIMGYIYEDRIHVDRSILVKNEYDIQLQSLFYYGKMLIDNRYRQVQHDMNNTRGGLANYRNSDVIRDAKERLLNKWGSKIVFGANSVKFNL